MNNEKKVRETLHTYLAKRQWTWHGVSNSSTIRLTHSKYRQSIYYIHLANGAMSFYAVHPFAVSKPMIPSLLAYITQVNVTLKVGLFELNVDTGEVRFRTKIYDKELITSSFLDLIFTVLTTTIDAHRTAIEALMAGSKTVEDAIAWSSAESPYYLDEINNRIRYRGGKSAKSAMTDAIMYLLYQDDTHKYIERTNLSDLLYHGKNEYISCRYQLMEKEDVLYFYAMLPKNPIPRKSYSAVMELLARLNYHGFNFVLDIETGDIWCKEAIYFRGESITKMMCVHAIHRTSEMMDNQILWRFIEHIEEMDTVITKMIPTGSEPIHFLT